MHSNYPDGMTSHDWDHVYGIIRCQECNHPMKEEEYCEDCVKCNLCLGRVIELHEPTDKYLCESCIEREEDND